MFSQSFYNSNHFCLSQVFIQSTFIRQNRVLTYCIILIDFRCFITRTVITHHIMYWLLLPYCCFIALFRLLVPYLDSIALFRLLLPRFDVIALYWLLLWPLFVTILIMKCVYLADPIKEYSFNPFI